MAGSPDQHAEERGNYERSADFLVQGDPGLPVAEIGEGEKDPLVCRRIMPLVPVFTL